MPPVLPSFALPAGFFTEFSQLRSPFWLPEGHTQTIVPALWLPRPAVPYRRERWLTPDGDFIDLDWLVPTQEHPLGADRPSRPERSQSHAPLLVLFHGLEGSSDSHYARVLMDAARQRGWRGVVPHFRSCSGEMNDFARFYHSGDAEEVDWILKRLRTSLPPGVPLLAVGISLGGNALLRWLGEQGTAATPIVDAAAAVSAPLDLAAGGHALARGFNRLYTRMFLKTLKDNAARKLQQFPGLFDIDVMQAARNLHEFDDVVTAPLHGFRDADDYWSRASSKRVLPDIRVPALILNARNDPFLPASALPDATQVSDTVTLLQPAHGGHVGFAAAALPSPIAAATEANDAPGCPGRPVPANWLARCLLTYFDHVLPLSRDLTHAVGGLDGDLSADQSTGRSTGRSTKECTAPGRNEPHRVAPSNTQRRT